MGSEKANKRKATDAMDDVRGTVQTWNAEMISNVCQMPMRVCDLKFPGSHGNLNE
jgi:hypothetical protein